MDSIIGDLLDMFPDTIVVTPRTYDRRGREILGAPFNVKAQVSGKTQEIRTAGGQTVTSGLQARVAGAYGLTQAHKYTLPARFNPRSPEALDVGNLTDENGAHHQVVYF